MSLQAHLFDLNVAMRVLYLHTVQTLKTKPYFPRVMVFVSLEVAFTFYSVMEFDSFKTFDFLMFDMTTCYGRVNDFQGVPFLYLICFFRCFLDINHACVLQACHSTTRFVEILRCPVIHERVTGSESYYKMRGQNCTQYVFPRSINTSRGNVTRSELPQIIFRLDYKINHLHFSMAPILMRRRRGQAEARVAVDVDKVAKARVILGNHFRTMKVKAWSAITCSDVDEQRYTNTIQKAMANLFDNDSISFKDMEPVFVLSGIFHKVKDSYEIHSESLKEFINELNSGSIHGNDFQIYECKPYLSDGTRAGNKYYFIMKGKLRDVDTSKIPILQLIEKDMVFDRVEAGVDGSIEVILSDMLINKPIELFPWVEW